MLLLHICNTVLLSLITEKQGRAGSAVPCDALQPLGVKELNLREAEIFNTPGQEWVPSSPLAFFKHISANLEKLEKLRSSATRLNLKDST